MNNYLTDKELKRMQLLQSEMIAELDKICRKYNIHYSLFCGTLLGAVRHKAHIPWDDDADIAMLREDYNRFREVAHELNPEICYFQDHKTDHAYLWGYGKLRRTGTTLIRKGQEHIHCQTGVYVDVFPLDDVPISVPGQIFQDFICYCYRKVLWSNVGCKTAKGLSKLWYRLLSFIPVDFVYKATDKYRIVSNNSTPNKVRCLLFPAIGKLYLKDNPLSKRYGMPKKWFLELDDYSFDGFQLKGTREYDAILRYEYGNYLQLPPENEQKPKVSFVAAKF